MKVLFLAFILFGFLFVAWFVVLSPEERRLAQGIS